MWFYFSKTVAGLTQRVGEDEGDGESEDLVQNAKDDELKYYWQSRAQKFVISTHLRQVSSSDSVDHKTSTSQLWWIYTSDKENYH